jgi:hypothetical protein
MVIWLAKAMAYRGLGTEESTKAIWKRIGYGSRYGNAQPSELLAMDQVALQDYLEAISDIVREENAASRR